MTEDRIQTPRLEKKGIDGGKIYNYRQWLERFMQNTKKKRYRYQITNQRRNNDQNRMKYKRRKDTTRFSSGIGTRSNPPNNTVRRPNRTGQN